MTFQITRSAFLLATALVLSGCISPPPTREVQYRAKAESSQALVTFVRERVYLGDAVALNLWDGDRFIGALSAGTIVQTSVAPGPHVFMASAENWAYLRSDLQPGKHYVVKANIFPGIMLARSALVAVENTDERLMTWPTKLKAKEIIPEKKDKYIAKHQPKATAAIQKANDENVRVFDMTTERHAVRE